MKKSKHFRKDVVIARIIAALLLVICISVISFAISLLTKSSDKDDVGNNTQNMLDTQDSQELQDTQDEQDTQDVQDTQDMQDSEDMNAGTGGSEPTDDNSDVNTNPEISESVYVKTTTRIKLRVEPNTECETLDRINGGTKLLVLDTLDGWYQVSYNGQIGYISADYARVVEE